ncbi:MAG TPA: hypothetical protein VNZ57_09660 [Longimicrobiales bacterium]|nr:hypothetical protein [Longimicrobiales bacterium]
MNRLERIYHRSPAWAQNVFLNAHAWRIRRHRYGAPFRQAANTLLEQERWPADRIRDYQSGRLRAIVAHAYAHSRYYREALDAAGVHPTDIRDVDDLAKLPILEKATVRGRAADLMTAARPARDWLKGNTSGTTGAPLSVWYDRATCIVTNAVDRRHKAWAGMRDDDWIGLLLGRVVVPVERRRPPFWRVNHVHRQLWFSSFHMNDETLGAFVKEIRRRRLRFLEGYPSTLFVLASYLIQRGETLPMQSVITSSETLHRAQLETIEAAFECRVFDFYALAERVIYAGECAEHEGKHIAEEYGITEIVDDGGEPLPPGRAGHLVGTSLHNTAMPMLRYRTGDISALIEEPCACGRTLRRLEPVTTKAEDIVVTPDGRFVSPSILTHPFKPFSQIRASQLVQEDGRTLVVKIVAGPGFTDEHWYELAAGLSMRLGPEMRIERVLVDEIPRERSGKYRWVVSRVDHRCALTWEAHA